MTRYLQKFRFYRSIEIKYSTLYYIRGMMTHARLICYLLLVISFFSSCKQRSILVAFEGVHTHDSILLEMYTNGISAGSKWIKPNRCADCFSYKDIPLAEGNNKVVFVNHTLGIADTCWVNTDSMTKTSFILVNADPPGRDTAVDTHRSFCDLYYSSSFFGAD